MKALAFPRGRIMASKQVKCALPGAFRACRRGKMSTHLKLPENSDTQNIAVDYRGYLGM
jgi:hypothetical protein